jgi:hypothetical protein
MADPGPHLGRVYELTGPRSQDEVLWNAVLPAGPATEPEGSEVKRRVAREGG